MIADDYLAAGCHWQVRDGKSINSWKGLWLSQAVIVEAGIDVNNLNLLLKNSAVSCYFKSVAILMHNLSSTYFM